MSLIDRGFVSTSSNRKEWRIAFPIWQPTDVCPTKETVEFYFWNTVVTRYFGQSLEKPECKATNPRTYTQRRAGFSLAGVAYFPYCCRKT
ncbi:MAG: hypothetical protein CXZ00_07010 [Acidobacteria bacterium]|nr:MAG: hypothetical protein CXZ00_07010 [Acidobacteriota bacterium]